MKVCTDIEQSKKLAEIIAIESADMIWDLTIPDLPTVRTIPYEDSDYNNKYLNIIPAWSLAALLDVLNKTAYFMDEDASVDLSSYKTIEWDLGITNSDLESVTESNPVDACYKMIINLHEQKIL